MAEDLADLVAALQETGVLLRQHGYEDVADRLFLVQMRLQAGERGAIHAALSEATGSMGSLRDVYIYCDGEAQQAANTALDRLVWRIERLAQ